jgi:hypothetical protein
MSSVIAWTEASKSKSKTQSKTQSKGTMSVHNIERKRKFEMRKQSNNSEKRWDPIIYHSEGLTSWSFSEICEFVAFSMFQLFSCLFCLAFGFGDFNRTIARSHSSWILQSQNCALWLELQGEKISKSFLAIGKLFLLTSKKCCWSVKFSWYKQHHELNLNCHNRSGSNYSPLHMPCALAKIKTEIFRDLRIAERRWSRSFHNCEW